jgi:hypothetical protein
MNKTFEIRHLAVTYLPPYRLSSSKPNILSYQKILRHNEILLMSIEGWPSTAGCCVNWQVKWRSTQGVKMSDR